MAESDEFSAGRPKPGAARRKALTGYERTAEIPQETIK